MINWSAMTEAQILLFALILLRMLAFIISSAIFGSPSISTPIKVLLSIAISVVLYPTVQAANVDYSLISNEIMGLAARELIVGLALGFLTRLFFFAVTMTGDLVALSVGLSSAQLYNPMLGSHGNTIDQFYSTIGTLIFLVIGGHHMLLTGIAQSYQLVPVSSLSLNLRAFGDIALYGQTIIMMAIKMCAPVLVTIFLANMAMGILGRAVPQINVLVTSMPVTIMLGMAVVFLCLPLLVMEMTGLAEITAGKLFEVMKQL